MTGKAVLAAFVTGAQKSYGKRSTGRSDVVAVPRRKVPLGPLRLDHALEDAETLDLRALADDWRKG